MICKNCGAELQENAAFCGNCGMKAEAEPFSFEQADEQGSFAAPVEPVYAEPSPAITEEKPNTVLWIVLSAVEMLMCCQISGVISLILSILGHVDADKGNLAEANKKIKYAKLSFWLGLALTVIFLVIYLIFVLLLSAGVFSSIAEFEDLYSYSYYY